MTDRVQRAADVFFALRGIAASFDGRTRIIGGLSAGDLVSAIDWLPLYEDGVLNSSCGIGLAEEAQALVNGAGAVPPAAVLCYLRACALSWKPEAPVIGHITAGRIASAVDALLDNGSQTDPVDSESAKAAAAPAVPCHRFGAWRAAAAGERRFSSPRPGPGQLKMQWGAPADNGPDLVAAGGEGTAKADLNLLFHAFTAPQWAGPLSRDVWEPPLLDELVSRGYDPETIRFSIRKKSG